jgi:glycosyltransferase involved in cell wall biosynthesis
MNDSEGIGVYVHLAYGFGAERWNGRWKSGALIGVNEPFAYGYHRAQAFGCAVTYSTDHPEGLLGKLFRYGVRLWMGFDFIHAWRNRRAIASSDVVWTHSESQSLAIAALLRLMGGSKRPKTIMQSVWLIDKWAHYNPLKKAIYMYLLSSADILTFHAFDNANEACRIFSGKRIERVQFGINADQVIPPPSDLDVHRPLRLLSIGNDAHRDWATLRQAFMGCPDYTLRVVTSRLPKGYLKDNAEVVRVSSNDELLDLYRWADIVVVPLKANLHASGITVVQEATTRGLPVVCTDTGGLKDYFPPSEVKYAPLGDPAALRLAVDHVAADAALRTGMVRLAQSRMKEGGLNSESFVRMHIELSRELI